MFVNLLWSSPKRGIILYAVEMGMGLILTRLNLGLDNYITDYLQFIEDTNKFIDMLWWFNVNITWATQSYYYMKKITIGKKVPSLIGLTLIHKFLMLPGILCQHSYFLLNIHCGRFYHFFHKLEHKPFYRFFHN